MVGKGDGSTQIWVENSKYLSVNVLVATFLKTDGIFQQNYSC